MEQDNKTKDYVNRISDYYKSINDPFKVPTEIVGGTNPGKSNGINTQDFEKIKDLIEDHYYTQQKSRGYKPKPTPEQEAKEETQRELNRIMFDIVKQDSMVGVLKILINNPTGLTLTGFLDKNRIVHECLQEGFLERQCDRGTHYYVLTRDGRMAVDMDSL